MSDQKNQKIFIGFLDVSQVFHSLETIGAERCIGGIRIGTRFVKLIFYEPDFSKDNRPIYEKLPATLFDMKTSVYKQKFHNHTLMKWTLGMITVRYKRIT